MDIDIILGIVFLFFLVLFGGITAQKELADRELIDPDYKAEIDKLNNKHAK
jgi:hypothetical protein